MLRYPLYESYFIFLPTNSWAAFACPPTPLKQPVPNSHVFQQSALWLQTYILKARAHSREKEDDASDSLRPEKSVVTTDTCLKRHALTIHLPGKQYFLARIAKNTIHRG